MEKTIKDFTVGEIFNKRNNYVELKKGHGIFGANDLRGKGYKWSASEGTFYYGTGKECAAGLFIILDPSQIDVDMNDPEVVENLTAGEIMNMPWKTYMLSISRPYPHINIDGKFISCLD